MKKKPRKETHKLVKSKCRTSGSASEVHTNPQFYGRVVIKNDEHKHEHVVVQEN